MEERRPIRTEVKLPDNVQAQLDRLAELEKQNAELLGEKFKLEAKLIERDIQAQHWEDQPIEKEVEIDGEKKTLMFYHHKIDLPPSGGTHLTRNGVQYFHGQYYDFAVDQLRDVREQEYRSWQHEDSIKGSNENIYRPKMNNTLSMRGHR